GLFVSIGGSENRRKPYLRRPGYIRCEDQVERFRAPVAVVVSRLGSDHTLQGSAARHGQKGAGYRACKTEACVCSGSDGIDGIAASFRDSESRGVSAAARGFVLPCSLVNASDGRCGPLDTDVRTQGTKCIASNPGLPAGQ